MTVGKMFATKPKMVWEMIRTITGKHLTINNSIIIDKYIGCDILKMRKTSCQMSTYASKTSMNNSITNKKGYSKYIGQNILKKFFKKIVNNTPKL